MKENSETRSALLAVVLILLGIIILDFLLLNEIIHPGIKFLKSFSWMHKNIFFIKVLYVFIVYFYLGVMPRSRMKASEDKRFIFITLSLFFSSLILISGIINFLYGIYFKIINKIIKITFNFRIPRNILLFR